MKQRLAFLFLPALLPIFSQPAFAQRATPVGVGGFGNVLRPGGVGVPTGIYGTAHLPGPVYGYSAHGQRPSGKKAKKVLEMAREGLSYRLIGRNLGMSKNTVMEIIKRGPLSAAITHAMMPLDRWVRLPGHKIGPVAKE